MSKKVFCNCTAWLKGLDPVGYASNITRMVALERELPWQSRASDCLPTYFQPAYDHAKRIKVGTQTAGSVMGISNLVLTVPEKETTVDGMKRILIWERPTSLFAKYIRYEYLLPDWVLEDFCWALAFDADQLMQFDKFLVDHERPMRDFLVCTHGSRDAACGKYGYKLYSELKALSHRQSDVQVWRSSHFGGHVFAPTMIELPAAIYWGNLDKYPVQNIVNRAGNIAGIKSVFRGWSGAPAGFAQAADREMVLTGGWHWLAVPRQIKVIEQDRSEKPRWATVQIVTLQEVILLTVEISHHIETLSSSKGGAIKKYPQYRVTRLEREPVVGVAFCLNVG